MGRHRTLTILLTIGAWGAATEGSPLDDASAPPTTSSRAPLAAPASDYLKGGVGLFQKGDTALASKYLKVASDYRDQLQPGEQAQLDDYLAKLKPAPTDPAVKPASADSKSAATGGFAGGGSGVGGAGGFGGASSPAAASPAATARPDSGPSRGTSDLKSEARWKLIAAEEQLKQGNYDEATRIVEQVKQMPVKYGLFDKTPAKLMEAIAKARPKMAAAESGLVRDKATALGKLKEAREMLANNQFEQAEAIALDVNTWNLRYSVWEDKPSNVAAAARALRKRDLTRSMPLKAQPNQGFYDVLVSEARHLMASGKYDEAEAKAKQAMKMSVVPSITADRAESVLNDISTARNRTASTAPAAGAPVAASGKEAPSVVAERQANELLAKDQSEAAAAKFLEADRLRSQEAAQPAVPVASASIVDPSVRRTSAAGAPALEGPSPMPALGAEPPALDAPPLGDNAAQAPAPAAEPISVMPTPPSISTDGPAAGNKGAELLTQSKALFAAGNYPAAREKATEAKAGGYGAETDTLAEEMLAQIALSEQGGALAVYEAALEAIRGKPGVAPDFERARSLLTEVASSGAALDEGMMQKVQDLLMKLPKENAAKDGSGKATASDVPTNDAETAKVQQLNAEVGTKVAEARRLMETDPEKAIALLQATMATVKAADLPQAVARTMTRRLEVAIDLSKKDKVGFDRKMLDKDAKAEIELKKLRILEADKAKQMAIDKLLKEGEKAQSEGNYAKAEEVARKAIEIDPNNVPATLMAYKANLQRHYETYQRDKKDKEEGFLNELHLVDKAMVIDGNVSKNNIGYPKNFAEMSARRRQMALSDTRPQDPKALAIAKKLEEPITLNLNDQTLGEAISFVQNYTGLNVILDPKALNDEGLSRDSKVSLTANSIRLKTALKFMLRPLGLTYKVEDDVLLITSPLTSKDKTYSWTYPVADLVISPQKAQPTSNQPTIPTMPGADPAAMTLAMANTQSASSVPTSTVGQRVVTEADMYPLIQLITNTIAPNTWRTTDITSKGDNNAYGMGGAFGGDNNAADPAQPGSITPFMLSISLIIRHTAEVHEEVAELLKQLRRLQDLQVSIEVRFITVSDDFFEQISVDFDFNIQSRVVGKKSTFAIQNPANQLFSTTGNGGASTGTTTGTTTGGTTTGGGGTGGTGGGGTTGAGGNTTTGGGGATTGGGGGGTGGGGGASGGGGGFAGGGGGVGGAGGFGGGGAGGTAGGSAGNAGGSGVTNPNYLVNPFLDNSLGRRTPLVVGTAAPGIKNFTSDLGIPFTQGSATQIQPFNAIPTAGATLGISFLSDLEMFLFLTAAQGDTRNNIVQAPKITTFNGSAAFITNTQNQYYVAQLIPIVGPGSVAFLPTPAALPDGVQLSVTPVVSSDRRYVRLSLAPFFQTINGLQSFPVPAAVGGGGIAGQGTPINGQIQLPLTTTTTLNTTVTVPDGGTVLLGGVKRMREQRLEFGVPVLSKTPMINRLFRNIGIGRRTDSLMLMVTPKIIILEEEEARLGVNTVNPNP